MRLRKIDILGFKSFRERMTIELSEGMTAIVGPNGCGKSNVVDAIKWAMGDMSPKSLRGSEMQDVIFAGSEGFKPMGLAEVTLTFENTGDLPEETEWGDAIPREFREMSEIGVTRRLHRSGESEYLINKTPCRLMDIQNLLAGTGLGKQGYSIIEQNRVGFIVSSKPSERRLLIEEASGITRYKSQRERAQRRLGKADENLQRVNDILGEVQKQIRTLERQARRAAQHRRFADELKALDVGLLVARRDGFVAKIEELMSSREVAETERLNAESALSKHEGGLSDAKVEAFAADKKHAEVMEGYYRLETRMNIARARSESAAQGLEDARSRRETAFREVETQTSRRGRLTHELERVESELRALGETTVSEGAVREGEEELRSLQDELDAQMRDLSSSRGRLNEIRTEYHRVVDREEWLRQQASEVEERERELTGAIAGLEKEVTHWESKLQEAREHAVRSAARRDEAMKAQSQHDHTTFEARRRFEDAEKEARRARGRLVDVETQLSSLGRMRDSGEGFDEAVRQVLEWARREEREDVRGPVANLVRVDPEWERVLLAALGERISDIVVASREAARDAISAIESDHRVTFFVDPEFDPERFIADLQRRIELVEDLDAVEGFDEYEIWATERGEIVFSDGRIVAGHGKDAASGVLERQRRIDELSAHRDALLVEVSALETTRVASEEALREAVALAEESKAALEIARVDAAAAARSVEGEERELERTTRSLERLRSQMVPILRRQTQHAEEATSLQGRKESLAEERAERARDLEVMEEAVRAVQGRVERTRANVTEQRVELAQTRERERSLEDSKTRLTRSLESASSLIERYAKETEELAQRATSLEAELESTAGEREASERELGEAREATRNAKLRVDRAAQAVAEFEAGMRDRRKRLENSVAALQKLEATMREIRLNIEHVDDQLNETMGLELAEARQLLTTVEIPENEWASRRDYLRRRLESMGPVNAMAEQEFEEAQERNNFLTEQKDDLERSASDLRKAIAAMDRESRRRFKETFEAVDAKFQEIFPILFRGGHARLLLTDPDDLLATGVDIEVRPPGKRLQNVSLLSGGEKALTAVSLIFSIFLLKPTPFSLLDEVDAPLDEANVGRFAEMVHQMSATSQMIVITHSRRTMESADLLYGVTMQQPGVSKIVSVKLSDVDGRVAS